MGKLKLIMRILKQKKDPVRVAAAQESIRVTALKRQVETLDAINQEYALQIKAMSKELANHRENNFQEKLLEVGMNLFSGKSQTQNNSPLLNQSTPNTPSIEQQTQLETGVQYSDDQLINIAQSLGSATIQKLKSLAYDKFAEVVKSQVPNISETSIKRSREIIEVME